MSFENYTDFFLEAFVNHPKQAEILKRKKEILSEITLFYNYTPNSVLYIGFNPLILVDTSKEIFVTNISENVREYLKNKKIPFNYIPYNSLESNSKKFDSIIALDEYFTFFDNDDSQKKEIEKLSKLCSEYLITTCKDYKNQDFKDREFSTPALVRGDQSNLIFLEFHDYDLNNRYIWDTNVYQINNSNLKKGGPYSRKAMFFKQMAKFCYDSGAVSFTIHKNLMYKSLIKKNYEFVISVQFNKDGY